MIYQPAAGEAAENLKAARIFNNRAAVIEDSSYDGKWLKWKGAVNDIFTIVHQESLSM